MQAMAECSGPPQSACADALGTFYPSLETGGFRHPAFCTPIPMPASTPLILRKSRMRRRARTDLCGGRSVMIVPTATVMPGTDSQRRWPEVRLWAITSPSGVFQPEFVVHCLAESLLATEITFSRLNRCVSKQELNLLKFSTR